MEDEAIRRTISSLYRYILVDEYQDTNRLQADVIRHLASTHQNVMVVGDDAQSIYAFRGATFKNIMEFPSLFPGATISTLPRLPGVFGADTTAGSEDAYTSFCVRF